MNVSLFISLHAFCLMFIFPLSPFYFSHQPNIAHLHRFFFFLTKLKFPFAQIEKSWSPIKSVTAFLPPRPQLNSNPLSWAATSIAPPLFASSIEPNPSHGKSNPSALCHRSPSAIHQKSEIHNRTRNQDPRWDSRTTNSDRPPFPSQPEAAYDAWSCCLHVLEAGPSLSFQGE